MIESFGFAWQPQCAEVSWEASARAQPPQVVRARPVFSCRATLSSRIARTDSARRRAPSRSPSFRCRLCASHEIVGASIFTDLRAAPGAVGTARDPATIKSDGPWPT